MKPKTWVRILLLVIFAAMEADGQKASSYWSDMGEALFPNGKVTATTCHNVQIDFYGPWSNYAIPDGVDKETGEFTWAVLKVDVLRAYFDLSDLDEDKVTNHPIFSLDYIGKHKKGTKYVADTPAVIFSSKGINGKVTVDVVDHQKVDAIRGQANVTEKQMGVTTDLRKGAVLTFSDQQHADAFAKAIERAIVVCKAQ